MMQRQAHMSSMQGNAGYSPQINFIAHRDGSTPIMQEECPQSQSLRQVERQLPLPSEQGRLRICEVGLQTSIHTDTKGLVWRLQILQFNINHVEVHSF